MRLRLEDMNLSLTKRTAVSAAAAAIVIVILVLAFAAAIIFVPGVKSNLPGQTSTITSTSSSLPSNTCSSAPIESKLTTYNSQAITAGHVSVVQGGKVLSDASGSETLNTYNSASGYYSAPFTTTWNASAAYPDSITVGSVPYSDSNGNTVVCQVPPGSSNSVSAFLSTGQVYLAPASGASATTNTELIVGSSTSQTNSFPAAFPSSSLAVTAYLQGFSANAAGPQQFFLPATANQPITDYGGINNEPAQSVQENAGQSVYFGFYWVWVFNYSSIAFSGPAGTTSIPITGTTGEKAWAAPAVSSGTCSTSGVSTSAPCILSQVTFSVAKQAAPGHHIGYVLMFVGPTQLGYIQQYISTPAVASFGATGSSFGLKLFGGMFASVGGNYGGLHPTIEQHANITSTG